MFDYFSDQGIYTVTPANAIFVEANDGSGWVVVDSLTDNTIPGWNSYSYDLTGYDVSGVVSLRFRAESGGASNDFYNDILVDDVKVRETPSCIQPTFLGSSNLTAASADLDWTAGGTETAWNIQYDTVGFVPGTGTVVAITSNPYTLTGLNSQTSYDYWVQADCGNGDLSPWSGPHTFTTSCSTFSAPFTEGFESAGALPQCWTLGGGENWLFNNSGPNHVGNGGSLTGSTVSGNYYAVVDASGYTGANGSATLTTPLIDVSTLTNPELSFYLISDEEGTGFNSTLTVMATSGTTWDTVGSYTGNTNGWEVKMIDLSAYTSTVLIQFAFDEDPSTGAFYDDIAIDDVSVADAPSCYDPVGVSTVSVGSDSATIAWTADPSVTAWNYVLGAAGFDPLTGTPVAVTNSNLILTGLTPASNYDFYVQSDCGTSGVSNWIGPLSFCLLYTSPSPRD